MKIGIIVSNTDPELVWNALRFANTALLEEHKVNIFLLGQGVEIESIKSEKFNVEEQLEKFNQLSGQMLACGTCIKSRHQMQFDVCPISTMKDMLKLVEESDRVLTF
ncbi:MAG: DsrE family protein [Nitrososphaeraceae archaeon]